jgi:hypothetical protein
MCTIVDINGKSNYREQHELLLRYASYELRMCIGGPRISEDAEKKAALAGCKLVRAAGGRYKLFL